ncbi:MAG: hypothetical protein KC422_19100 [Trueperaceae bacterium]|nr:hypothetical protein [Trueperaceae bacterium]
MEAKKRALLGIEQEGLSWDEAREGIRELLLELGVADFYKQQGTMPKQQRLTPEIPAALPQTASRQAAELLGEVIDGRHADLLAEVLDLFKTTHTALPGYLLPPLLDKASKVYALRPQVLEALDERGHWLAAQHKDWCYAERKQLSQERFAEDWRSNSSSLRQGIFYQARMQDPKLALSLMQTTWKAETPAAVNWIIRLMATNLSMTDEAFLELALDDRNLTVRRKASELLSCLPGSRLLARMTEVAETCLEFDGAELQFELPEIRPELVRDGFLVRAWKDEAKLTQAYLADLVSAVPLDYWPERWDLSVKAFLDIVAGSQWREGMLKGLATAAERQKNAIWAKELIRIDTVSVSTLKLLGGLDEATFLELVQGFALAPEAQDHAFSKAFSRWHKPWSDGLTKLWLEHLPSTVKSLSAETRHLFMLRSSFKSMAKLVPITAFDDIAPMLKDYKTLEPLSMAVFEASSLLGFRKRMYQAFDLA